MFETHVHSKFSPDGGSTIEEYVEQLKKTTLSGIGFCEHLDFHPICGAYKYLKFDAYRAEVERFRDKGYQLWYGAEVDYMLEVQDSIIEQTSREKYDYLTCSIHTVNYISVSDRTSPGFFTNTDDFKKILEGYYREYKSGLALDIFDVLAHTGVYKRYLTKEHLASHPLKSMMDELDNEASRLVAASDKLLEVNTSGYFNKFADSVPDIDFLKSYYNYGGRRITIGSDAHNAENLGRGFDKAIETLKEIGFSHVYLPWDKENPLSL